MNLLFGFSGRVGRLQWWLAQLVMLVVMVLGVVAIAVAVGTDRLSSDRSDAIGDAGLNIVMIVCAICVLVVWINLASTVKRFHDRDKSGWWVLILLVPYVGAIWQIVECGFFAGSAGSNDYGPTPGAGGSAYAGLGDDEIGYPRPERQRSTPAVQAEAPARQETSTVRRPPAGGFGRRGV